MDVHPFPPERFHRSRLGHPRQLARGFARESAALASQQELVPKVSSLLARLEATEGQVRQAAVPVPAPLGRQAAMASPVAPCPAQRRPEAPKKIQPSCRQGKPGALGVEASL